MDEQLTYLAVKGRGGCQRQDFVCWHLNCQISELHIKMQTLMLPLAASWSWSDSNQPSTH